MLVFFKTLAIIKMEVVKMFRIELFNGVWQDSGEGPFETLDDALDFSRNEIGVDSRIHEMTPVFRTTDGYTLRLVDGEWTDGEFDLCESCRVSGSRKREGIPD